jgi:hypothetical protein
MDILPLKGYNGLVALKGSRTSRPRLLRSIMRLFTAPYCRTRLRVASAATQRVEAGQPGILCFGFPPEDGNPALVVVWDEDINSGASATNSIETVLRYLDELWGAEFAVTRALVVERDSAGDFDHANPSWESDTALLLRRTPLVSWQPLKWPGCEPRSTAAFVAMFGERARAVLAVAGQAAELQPSVAANMDPADPATPAVEVPPLRTGSGGAHVTLPAPTPGGPWLTPEGPE